MSCSARMDIPSLAVFTTICPAPAGRLLRRAQIPAEEIIKERFGDAFPNALGFDPGRPDVLAAALYQGEQIAALAGASADSARFWQIGIDVLPEFERQGMGKYLVALLRQEIFRRGKIPYYGTSEANLASRGIAAATGFVPAWAEAACKKEK